ncbi:unnamed protein product [Arabis nemorensis]|uniref:Uncharacterized protein n=1 Tax=Arabis nemorensis TaxID=586526 RepID=A0A565C148_9BRAS|nr:unnamed protein product [Arabis nemorensis]
MAVPVKEISDSNGVSREEFSLNQLSLPLTVEEPSPEVSINVKSPSEVHSTPPRMTDSVRISNPPEEKQRREGIEAAEALMAASRANVNRNIKETCVCEESAETVPMVIHSRRTLLNSSQVNDKLIDTFCDTTGGATRAEATACLNLCNWDVGLAVNYFFDHPSSHGGFSEEETLAVVEMNWQENSGNQGHSKEGEIGNSSSSVHADSTKTGRPSNEAGLVNVPVAVSGIATSQVVENWKPEAVDEDPSTLTGPDPLATKDRVIVGSRAGPVITEITLQVLLPDGRNGKEEFMTFRSDQTVRDIRNRIQELRPDCNRDYYLTSVEGEIYNALNTTVQRIHSRGATKLLKVFSDS